LGPSRVLLLEKFLQSELKTAGDVCARYAREQEIGTQADALLGKIKDGTEYEDEFEYEYDWGTIARLESLLGGAMPISSVRLRRCDRPRPSSLLVVPESYSNSSSNSVF
jgi:hypothetical protein